MKLANYRPTYRWVLLEPIMEDKVGSLYIPVASQRAHTYEVIKAGPQCETVKEGQRVIVETGPMIDMTFQENKQLYYQVLEMRIIGVEDDSSRNTYPGKPEISGDRIT